MADVGWSQTFSQRGFLETRLAVFPSIVPGDSGRAVGEGLLRWEGTVKLGAGFQVTGGMDARTDTHLQTVRTGSVSLDDRSVRRPALAVRRLSAIYNRGRLTVEAGRQFIRWGKADLLNPTDRFAPRDFMNVVNSDFLGVTAARATYDTGTTSLDLVWSPWFTPSRTPLLNQRWVVLPPEVRRFPLADAGARYPGRGQVGARVNHVGRGYEASVMVFDGVNHLPLIEPVFALGGVRRYYPRLTMVGGDAAVPLPWFTVKAEAGYYGGSNPAADRYVIYVIQAERQSGEWSFVGGYAGEAVTDRRNPVDFAPDRGMARSFLGRAGLTIDANQSVAFETAVRQNGKGMFLKSEYTRAIGAHWRAAAAFVLIQGSDRDFLGQYNRNSHGLLTLRYSF
ncbi:MAG: hypothetical protein FJW40_19655 [Acidobacteria bacterium]|nr:hypothetical protein [Acidobacteriota bacterium]